MISRICLLVMMLCMALQSLAQGEWTPAGADLSYPRTLLKARQVAGVQQALSLPGNQQLYAGLYNSVNTTPPAAPGTEHDPRRSHATFAKNLAFVVLMDRKVAGPGLTSLTAEEKALFAGRVRTLLETLNTTVEAWPSSTNWQWTSKELIDYLIAYDLLRGAGESEAALLPAKARLQEFAGNLYAQTQVNIFGYTFFSAFKNNHALMTASALGLAAVVLPDAGSTTASRQPGNWIRVGMFHVDNVLWRDAKRQSDPNAIAGYAEGPYYFKYAFLNCLPFIRSMGNFLPDGSLDFTVGGITRSIRNPFYDPSYDRLYQWMSAILMPDGRFPALEDSFVDMGMPELALTGKSAYLQPMNFSNFAPGQMASLEAQLRDATVDMRAAYLAANLVPSAPSPAPVTALPQSGNLVFRSDNTDQAHYLHLYGKNGLAQSVTGGHNQGDASSFILHAKGQLLALDPGYLSSGKRDSLGNAANHNLILVDGAGPLIGADGSTRDAEAFIGKSFFHQNLAYGEVRTAYLSANITRKTLALRSRYFLISDFVQSSAPHNFTWQLHGYGLEGGSAATGTFTDRLADQQASWHHNGVSLQANVTATGQASAYHKATKTHERIWNQSEKHTTLLVEKNGVSQTQFLSSLVPYTDQAPTVTTLSTAAAGGLKISGPDFQDLAMVQADTGLTSLAGLPEPVYSDGFTTLVSLDADQSVQQVFLEQGRTLSYGSQTLIRSSKRANISWQQLSPDVYSVYASEPTTLSLPVATRPSTVDGASAYSYDESAQTLSLTLDATSSPAGIRYTLPLEALPVKLVAFSGRQLAGEVLLSWKTATEQQNSGFALQRRSEQEEAFRQVAWVPGAGTKLSPSQYQYRDAEAPAGQLYYRLLQTDLDGTQTFSAVIAVKNPGPAPAALQVKPVPADRQLQVSWSGPGKAAQLQLLSLQGQVLQRLRFERQAALDVSSLPAGYYVLQALDAGDQPVAPPRKILVHH
ncbi:MAG: heparinase II/III domain-containing protein [Adhaeribacter sp.]